MGPVADGDACYCRNNHRQSVSHRRSVFTRPASDPPWIRAKIRDLLHLGNTNGTELSAVALLTGVLVLNVCVQQLRISCPGLWCIDHRRHGDRYSSRFRIPPRSVELARLRGNCIPASSVLARTGFLGANLFQLHHGAAFGQENGLYGCVSPMVSETAATSRAKCGTPNRIFKVLITSAASTRAALTFSALWAGNWHDLMLFQRAGLSGVCGNCSLWSACFDGFATQSDSKCKSPLVQSPASTPVPTLLCQRRRSNGNIM